MPTPDDATHRKEITAQIEAVEENIQQLILLKAKAALEFERAKKDK